MLQNQPVDYSNILTIAGFQKFSWAYGVVVSTSAVIWVRMTARAVKFDIANLGIKVPSGSNILFLCPLDVFKVLYCTIDLMPCCQVNSCIEGSGVVWYGVVWYGVVWWCMYVCVVALP